MNVCSRRLLSEANMREGLCVFLDKYAVGLCREISIFFCIFFKDGCKFDAGYHHPHSRPCKTDDNTIHREPQCDPQTGEWFCIHESTKRRDNCTEGELI